MTERSSLNHSEAGRDQKEKEAGYNLRYFQSRDTVNTKDTTVWYRLGGSKGGAECR